MKINKDALPVITHKLKNIFILFSFVSLLYSCGALRNEEASMVFSKGIPSFSSWVILPFRVDSGVNITDKMLVQFERVLKVQLPSYGIVDSKLTDERNRKVLQIYNSEQAYVKNIIEFAKVKKAEFAISAKVNKVKTIDYGNCYIGIDLVVYDIKEKTPVWYVRGRRQGSSHEDLLSVYRSLIADLLKLAPIGD